STLLSALLLGAFMALRGYAKDVYVNNQAGNDDTADGTREKPYATIMAAVEVLENSDSLHLTATGIPYRPTGSIHLKGIGGTPEKPLIIDGHGATITWRRRYGVDQWKDEGEGIFSRKMGTNSAMKRHWEGFDLVMFDGRPGTSCVCRAALEPFGYVLYTRRSEKRSEADVPPDTLFIRLPEAKTPADVVVETCAPGGLNIGVASHIVVRNLCTMWVAGDGMGSYFCHDLLYENVESAFNTDQGMSHHSSSVDVRDSHFHHNAGCGIVDVRLASGNAQSRYVNCLVENDSYRGGVEFQDGDYEMENCIVRNNAGLALQARRGSAPRNISKVRLKNCVFIGNPNPKTRWPQNTVEIGPNCYGSVVNCTFYGIAMKLHVKKNTFPTEIFQCAFIPAPYGPDTILTINGLDKTMGGSVISHYNYFASGEIRINHIDSPRLNENRQVFSTPEVYLKNDLGLERGSVSFPLEGELSPYNLSGLNGKGRNGDTIGAYLEVDEP
ncbi:MAG: right-handed parallel beta-helix repeat-containing protein, partial [Candidatus Pacebacteria bacterium]|nr:right-handed parallel beta-helix repeat-containing protein [Candidatus Paceibacterota bacterium]